MKFTKMGEWCESADGERFYDGFNTKEKAIEFVQEEYGEGYIGESVAVEFTADDFNWDADYALGELLYLSRKSEMSPTVGIYHKRTKRN